MFKKRLPFLLTSTENRSYHDDSTVFFSVKIPPCLTALNNKTSRQMVSNQTRNKAFEQLNVHKTAWTSSECAPLLYHSMMLSGGIGVEHWLKM